jgi:hypothetical protein
MSNLYGGPSIDASYQVSVHLAEGFQRRRLKCEKLTDDGCQKLTWQGELKITEQNLDCVFHLTATIASSNDDNNSFNVFVKLFFFCKFHKLLHNRRQGYGTTNDLSHLRKAC